MKCKVCGNESGKYPLCFNCNRKKEQGEIIKCKICNTWHYKDQPCKDPDQTASDQSPFLYDPKQTLISKNEAMFFDAIREAVPENYCVFPQINLAAFIERTDNSPYHNELFRNVDFLITNADYQPLIVIEINDQSHLANDRRLRDEKVQNICEEAGIPFIKLWTSYGVNREYIQSKIFKTLEALPATRIHHFAKRPADVSELSPKTTDVSAESSKKGCYIATCVYGSYDCPSVWLLRRYRDQSLSRTWYGRLFIRCYYCISPLLVKAFGEKIWFQNIFKRYLDHFSEKLKAAGYSDTPYHD